MAVILAGDIGGTKTVVALLERSGDGLARVRERSYRSAEHPGLEEILDDFLARERADVEGAAFGVAGVVRRGRASTTNLPWRELDAGRIAERLGLARVELLNDLEAAAYGMLVLPASDLVSLTPGVEGEREANMAVVAAGTGLGEALLVWTGSRHQAVATEGGHTDFPPRTEEEIRLLRFLQQDLGDRVSSERVVSGPGFHDVYRFARHDSGEPEPDWLRERLAEGDPSAVVAEVALDGKDPVCARALELFVSLYGAEAGNVALQVLALGGVFIGGGIAPKILPALQDGRFVEAFTAKGRFAELLRGIPVRVATNAAAPLLGAAHRAAGLL